MSTVLADPTRRRRYRHRHLGVVGLIGVFLLGANVAGCAGPSSAADGAGDVAGASANTSAPNEDLDQPTPDPLRPDSSRSATATTLWAERPGDIDVVVVGDSLTVSAADEIRASLAQVGVRSVEVDAVEGRRMATDLDGKPSGVAAIGRFATTGASSAPDIWVIALGTNDVGAEAQPDELDRAIGEVLGELDRSSSVVWIDVFIDAKAEASAEFDAQIRQVAIERGGMVVGDWFHPAQDDGVLVGDGVHLTSTGREAFAETIAATVARLVPAQNGVTTPEAAELGN